MKHAEDAVVVPSSIDIQGHRGARGLRPEETLPALEAALDLQVDTLEFDLHLTADDRLVLWHDGWVGPTKCATPKTKVRERTAAELRKLRCDRNPDPERFPRQRPEPGALAGDDWGIVTLEEALDFVSRYAASESKTDAQRANAATVRFNIETKRDPDDPSLIGDGFDGETAGTFEREFVRVVRERGLLDRVTLQSFDHRSLWAAKKLEPSLTLAALEGRDARGEPEFGASWTTWAARGATIWSPDHRLLDATSVVGAQAAGLSVVPWTVNDRSRIEELVGIGVDGVITDRPDVLRH